MKYWSAGGIWIINDWIKAAELSITHRGNLQIGALNIPVQTQSCINTADGPLHTQLQTAFDWAVLSICKCPILLLYGYSLHFKWGQSVFIDHQYASRDPHWRALCVFTKRLKAESQADWGFDEEVFKSLINKTVSHNAV